MNRVLMLELNELTPALVDRFMKRGQLPNFSRLHDQSAVYLTETNATGLDLNPWVQWVSVHTGREFDDHKVFLLGEGHKADVRTIADEVSAAGLCVGVFGSMNIPWKAPANGFVFPDAWASQVKAYPESLEPFRKFVQSNVQEHTNPEFSQSGKDIWNLVRFLAANGLSANTALAIVVQLVRERLDGSRWKRSFILDRLQWDIFRAAYRRYKPHFATFFSNSVAHAQHTHWREFEPDSFSLKPSDSEISRYKDVIPTAYRKNDEIIGKALDLVDDDTVIIFCTALSQQPATRWDSSGGKTFYRPRNIEQFCRFAGAKGSFESRPVMAEEFWINPDESQSKEEIADLFRAVTCDGRQLLKVNARDDGVYTGCVIYDHVPDNAVVRASDGRTAVASDLLYRSEDVKSGMHDNKGLLWISTPNDRKHSSHSVNPVPLEAIAPTVLQILNVPIPSYMGTPPLSDVIEKCSSSGVGIEHRAA